MTTELPATCAWAGEWEAALESTLRAVSETPLKAMDSRNWDKASIVMRLLEEISDSVRHNSPTVGTLRQNPAPEVSDV
jgi:hypothetical protein